MLFHFADACWFVDVVNLATRNEMNIFYAPKLFSSILFHSLTHSLARSLMNEKEGTTSEKQWAAVGVWFEAQKLAWFLFKFNPRNTQRLG